MKTAKLIVNIFFFAVGIIAAIVGAVCAFKYAGTELDQTFSLLLVLGIAFSLTTCFGFRSMLVRKTKRLKAVKILLLILGIIGIAVMALFAVFGSLILVDGDYLESLNTVDGKTFLYMGSVAVGCILSLIFSRILKKFDELFPSLRNWPDEFFEGFGYYILLPLFFGLSLLTGYYVHFISFGALVFNILFLSLFIILRRSDRNVLAFVSLGGCLLGNAILTMILMLGTNAVTTDFTSVPNTFAFTTLTFVYLATIVFLPFNVINKLSDKVGPMYESIVAMIAPIVCFGLQILMLYYWYYALIGVVAVFAVLLVIGMFLEFFENLFSGSKGRSGGSSRSSHASSGGGKATISDVEYLLSGRDFGYDVSYSVSSGFGDKIVVKVVAGSHGTYDNLSIAKREIMNTLSRYSNIEVIG